MKVGKLLGGAALLLLMPSGMNACRCARPSVCEGVDNADVVVRAVLVSRYVSVRVLRPLDDCFVGLF